MAGGLLIAGASLVAEHRLSGTQASVAAERGLRSWNSQALALPGLAPQLLWRLGCLLCCMWDLPGPGIEPVSPTSAGGFVTTGPPREVPDEQFFFKVPLTKVPSS